MPRQKGFKHTKETKDKMRETRKSLGLLCPSFKGKKHTDKWKKEKSERMKGITSWAKDKKFSEEYKQKLSKSHIGKNCSIETRKKMSIAHSGNKTNFWKGGITEKNKRERTTFEIKLWKKACLERDNYTCQKTKRRGGKLQVHHINNFADFPELRTSIENGITFSKESHELFHKIYGKRNNTLEQVKEFLIDVNVEFIKSKIK